MQHNFELRVAVKDLTVREILHILPERCFTSAQKRSRPQMEKAIDNFPSTHHELLIGAYRVKRFRTSEDSPAVTPDAPLQNLSFLQPSESNSHATGVTPHVPVENPSSPEASSVDGFFHTVSDDCRKKRISKFIDATGNNALLETVCMVCAGRFKRTDTECVRLSHLEEKNLLSPTRPHDAHVLTNGMLLHRSPRTHAHQTDNAGFAVVDVCNPCVCALRRNKTPALALANEMWIGDVPLEIKVLMLPERILIARFFPAAYIVKLYPKKKGARFWANANLHCGLRGNVSTYRLNTDDIVSMIGDDTLPASSSILAATIGVTFVGPKNMPQKTMPGFLHVNRNRVRDALVWLKTNNPIYYDIKICESRLNDLPSDDIPPEIMSLVRVSDDTDLLAAEHDGYVPDNIERSLGTHLTTLNQRVHHIYLSADHASGIGGILDIENGDETNGDVDDGTSTNSMCTTISCFLILHVCRRNNNDITEPRCC